ncbi:MAG: amino acid ABC transporter substrate-binding protein, partial [Gammaproteobacteria bacterium]|nr:amino acid ABC transporter substrate-binding protein [Gammaproteobacteria bacterium]
LIYKGISDKLGTKPTKSGRRLLGVTGGLGKRLGLSNEWAYNVIYLVGNYNDIWTRNFGYTGLERGLNALWTNGGLLFAVPVR